MSTWTESIADHRARQVDVIANAAITLSARRGLSGLTMSAIADEAGVGRATLYRYFDDVEAVLAAAVQRQAEVGEARLRKLLSGVGTPTAKLIVLVDAGVGAAEHGHQLARYSAGLPPAVQATMGDHQDRVQRMIEDVLRAGVADGSFRADLDPAIDARLLINILWGVEDLIRGGSPRDPVAKAALRTALGAVGAEG